MPSFTCYEVIEHVAHQINTVFIDNSLGKIFVLSVNIRMYLTFWNAFHFYCIACQNQCSVLVIDGTKYSSIFVGGH